MQHKNVNQNTFTKSSKLICKIVSKNDVVRFVGILSNYNTFFTLPFVVLVSDIPKKMWEKLYNNSC